MPTHMWMLTTRIFSVFPLCQICYRCGLVKYVDTPDSPCQGLSEIDDVADKPEIDA